MRSPHALLLALSLSLAGALLSCAPPGGDDDIGVGDSDSGVDDGVPELDAGNLPARPDAAVPDECEEAFALAGYADASSVLLTGDFTGWAGTPGGGAIPLAQGASGWTVTHTFQPGNYLYKFVVDGDTWIHDESNPRTAEDGFGGFNSVFDCGGGDPAEAVCGDPEVFDWRDAVMYFVMVDRFHDGDGAVDPVAGATDGDARFGSSGQYEGGDLSGVSEKLPYLNDLGVTAIWLSAPFENRNGAGAAIDPVADPRFYSGYHGYWPSPQNVDYSVPDAPSPRPQVESRIGSEADLRGVIDDAHTAGMQVMFDYVMNHVDIDSGLYQAHPDWFVRRESGQFALCGPENLWDDPYWGTRCAFTDYLPPFDLYNPEARQWSVDDAVWWAKEYGIDGYRLDAIKHVPLSWLQQLRTRLNSEFPDPAGGRFYLVGETFDYFNRDLLKSFIDPKTMLDGQFDFPFKRQTCEALFDPGGSIDGLSSFMSGNDTFYNVQPDVQSIMTTWIGNHDIPRAIHFASWQMGNCTEGSHPGNGWTSGSFSQPQDAAPYERLGLAFASMMTNPGIPLIYYGDEIGLAGGGDPDNRRMMPWDDGTLNEHQLALRAKVAKLAAIRKQYKILARGARETIHADQDVWAYKMAGCDEELVEVTVAINRADDSRSAPVPDGAYTDLMTDAPVDVAGDLSLRPRSFVVLVTR